MKRFTTTIAFSLLLAITLHATIDDASIPVTKPPTVLGLIQYYSAQYEVSPDRMEKTIDCESSGNPLAVNSTKREYSVGLSQINLKAHKDITVEQATDPDFAIQYMAENFATGHAEMWSCWQKLYGNKVKK